MTQFDTAYQAFRREELHKLSNMDPDDLVSELKLESENIIDGCWEEVEIYIQEKYLDGDEEESEQDSDY
jgi:hypothetical protein